MRRKLGLSAHDFLKLLFDLQDGGLVTFKTMGNGPNMRPTNIRLRPAGTVYRSASPAEPNEEATEPAPQPRPQLKENGAEELAEGLTNSMRGLARAASTAVTVMQAYPRLSRLMVRARRYEALSEAAAVLERNGLIDEAAELISKVEFDQLEQEVIRFLRERLPRDADALAEQGGGIDRSETRAERPVGGVNSPPTDKAGGH
jgi:hypothetical protein